MKNQSKNSSGISTLKLILIITGSIVAAAGIIFLVYKLLKKKQAKKAFDGCCFCEDEDWELDDDILGELRFDDDEDCDCDNLTESVDDAIDAVESVLE